MKLIFRIFGMNFMKTVLMKQDFLTFEYIVLEIILASTNHWLISIQLIENNIKLTEKNKSFTETLIR